MLVYVISFVSCQFSVSSSLHAMKIAWGGGMGGGLKHSCVVTTRRFVLDGYQSVFPFRNSLIVLYQSSFSLSLLLNNTFLVIFSSHLVRLKCYREPLGYILVSNFPKPTLRIHQIYQ